MCTLLVVAGLLKVGGLANLVDRRSLARVVGQKAYNEVPKVHAQAKPIYRLEVVLEAMVADHVVVLVLEHLGAVGELALHHDEEEDAHREEIDLGAVIVLLFEDLGGDVAWRAHSSLDLAQVSCVTQSEIDQLKGQVAVDEDVLQLEVPVHDAC